jgi:hypothetical protein
VEAKEFEVVVKAVVAFGVAVGIALALALPAPAGHDLSGPHFIRPGATAIR